MSSLAKATFIVNINSIAINTLSALKTITRAAKRLKLSLPSLFNQGGYIYDSVCTDTPRRRNKLNSPYNYITQANIAITNTRIKEAVGTKGKNGFISEDNSENGSDGSRPSQTESQHKSHEDAQGQTKARIYDTQASAKGQDQGNTKDPTRAETQGNNLETKAQTHNNFNKTQSQTRDETLDDTDGGTFEFQPDTDAEGGTEAETHGENLDTKVQTHNEILGQTDDSILETQAGAEGQKHVNAKDRTKAKAYQHQTLHPSWGFRALDLETDSETESLADEEPSPSDRDNTTVPVKPVFEVPLKTRPRSPFLSPRSNNRFSQPPHGEPNTEYNNWDFSFREDTPTVFTSKADKPRTSLFRQGSSTTSRLHSPTEWSTRKTVIMAASTSSSENPSPTTHLPENSFSKAAYPGQTSPTKLPPTRPGLGTRIPSLPQVSRRSLPPPPSVTASISNIVKGVSNLVGFTGPEKNKPKALASQTTPNEASLSEPKASESQLTKSKGAETTIVNIPITDVVTDKTTSPKETIDLTAYNPIDIEHMIAHQTAPDHTQVNHAKVNVSQNSKSKEVEPKAYTVTATRLKADYTKAKDTQGAKTIRSKPPAVDPIKVTNQDREEIQRLLVERSE
ncbi:hypothetical protein FZEAL_5871 [Fusarium zealandicum]|uniref:Uncharacterized protein n=1 Tax=Fusarium zealandicum TaxID=1053134 RepID=A0A8H4UJS8_9HYPO|nr:hypothetical protein FZEAL_5871 [Fusarium zealandicum]